MDERRPATGRRLQLEVGPVAHGGHCVARHDGHVVFVRHALPGEQVEAEITGSGKGGRFLRADAVRVLRASPDRVEPPCPYAGPGRCGGCDWQHADLSAQRRLKAAVVVEQLERLGRIEQVGGRAVADAVRVEPVPGDRADRDGLGWRTRVAYAVAPDGVLGLHRHRSQVVEPVATCRIAHPDVVAAAVTGRSWSGYDTVEVVASGTGEQLVLLDPPPPVGDTRAGRATLERLPVGVAVAGVRGRSWVDRGRRRTALARRRRRVLAGPPRGCRRARRRGPRAAGAPARRARCSTSTAGSGCSPVRWPATSVLAGRSTRSRGRRGRCATPVATCTTCRRCGCTRPASDPGWPRAGRAAWTSSCSTRRAAGAGRAVVRHVLGLGPRAVAYVACDPAALARDLRPPWSRATGGGGPGLRPVPDDAPRRVRRAAAPSPRVGPALTRCGRPCGPLRYLDIKINVVEWKGPSMTSQDSFGAKSDLRVGDETYEIFRISAVEGARPAPVQPQGAAGEPAAHRGRRQHHRRDDPRPRCVGPVGRAERGDPVHARRG